MEDREISHNMKMLLFGWDNPVLSKAQIEIFETIVAFLEKAIYKYELGDIGENTLRLAVTSSLLLAAAIGGNSPNMSFTRIAELVNDLELDLDDNDDGKDDGELA